jgi:AraC family transcriptional regulator, transcriptional activator FtrA
MISTSPLRWLLAQRVHRAQELLETTETIETTVELIADRTGMGTAATLRRHFNRLHGVPS